MQTNMPVNERTSNCGALHHFETAGPPKNRNFPTELYGTVRKKECSTSAQLICKNTYSFIYTDKNIYKYIKGNTNVWIASARQAAPAEQTTCAYLS